MIKVLQEFVGKNITISLAGTNHPWAGKLISINADDNYFVMSIGGNRNQYVCLSSLVSFWTNEEPV